jgi:mono/diheme cytochrome c family protein
MSRRGKTLVVVLGVIVLLVAVLAFRASRHPYPEPELTTALERQGKEIFQDDTFGDEKFWTDTARLHEVVDGEIQPIEALRLGLKVDLDRLNLLRFVLHNPLATSGTRELLRQNAVVGVRATFDEEGRIARLGITCALCHSTVDNALLPGIGHRLDGWPNTSLELGKILAKLPAFSDSQKALLLQWPKGTYDPRFNFDGRSTPLVLPPAYGLAEVANETYTAEGPISYWNAYVAVTQMHGQGNFSDPRLGVAIAQEPDLVTPKLEALKAYQHALSAPPPSGFDEDAAARGRIVFDRACAQCHVNGNGTDNNNGVLHDPAETGMDATYASRTTARRYRTTPLRGLRHHPPYFHDGSAATLRDVVLHYDRVRQLGLSAAEQRDIEEFLKSL